ncbi:MAG: TonB-dependent receptor [Candidatus Marinimicrobia bacterium]|nr:TonB-dependent receptor [Candidatus Neomarinimicrobiota bacterium]
MQFGLLSSLSKKVGNHDLTVGTELRQWNARHVGFIMNNFGADAARIDFRTVDGDRLKVFFQEGDAYYDYTGDKPQASVFGHMLWRFGDLSVMTDAQYSIMNYTITEDLPSSNNRASEVGHGGANFNFRSDQLASGETWSLWTYEQSFSFLSPKLGANYNLNENLNVFGNFSIAYNEPRVKYFFFQGQPRELELEKSNDLEFGLGYTGQLGDMPADLKLNLYNIDFENKVLRVTVPTLANEPGYDYKGRQYVPLGDATYKGVELAFNLAATDKVDFGIIFSKSSNKWGAPENDQGKQFLYGNGNGDDLAAVAGTHFTDSDGDGKWDSGEISLKSGQELLDEFGAKTEIGMPQMIIGSTINYDISRTFKIGAALRNYRDIYFLEDNGKNSFEKGADGTWGTDDDVTDNVLPSATVIDIRTSMQLSALSGISISLHINNLLDTEYWQSGSVFGFLPGAQRTVILSTNITL